MSRKGYYILIAVMIIAIIAVQRLNNQYEPEVKQSEWRSNGIGPVAKVLLDYEIKGCASLYIKPTEYDNEYYVACSSDLENWTYYEVNIDRGVLREYIGKALTPPETNKLHP